MTQRRRGVDRRFRGFPAALALGLLAAAPARAASWQTNVNYGTSGNPTMDLYVPDRPDASPGVLVAIHYCGGNAGGTHSWFQSLADQYGFIIISPNAGTNCFDASPGRNGAKAAIANMVKYVIQNKNADPTRIFSAGASSGACMTNALVASYPDVFAAGSALAGVPVGGWPAGNTSCSGICNTTAMQKTAMQWGDIVRNADPGFTGTRPRVQLWHGTSDPTLVYPSQLDAEVAQFTNVFGVTSANATMMSNTPKSGWTRTSYKDSAGTVVLEVNIGQGLGHDLTGQGFYPDIVRFFGLDKDTGGSDGGATGSGGTTGAGGRSGSTGTAGVQGIGGAAAGGRGGTTGVQGTAGSATGGTSAGGTNGRGGNPGAAGTSAAAGTTGAAGTGPRLGGTTGAAGTSASAGTTGGGPAGTTASGGTPATAGTSGGGGTSGETGDNGGCACELASRTGSGRSRLAVLLLAMAGVARGPRRRPR